MKRENNLISMIADPDNLRLAFWKARKAKERKMEVAEYRKYLASDNEEQTGFYPRHLEEFINKLIEVIPADWTQELKERYLGNE